MPAWDWFLVPLMFEQFLTAHHQVCTAAILHPPVLPRHFGNIIRGVMLTLIMVLCAIAIAILIVIAYLLREVRFAIHNSWSIWAHHSNLQTGCFMPPAEVTNANRSRDTF
jgi:hypothetical protein